MTVLVSAALVAGCASPTPAPTLSTPTSSALSASTLSATRAPASPGVTAVSAAGLRLQVVGATSQTQLTSVTTDLKSAVERVALTWGSDKPAEEPISIRLAATMRDFIALGGADDPAGQVAATATDPRTIVLSPNLLSDLPPAGVVTVLAHELTHLVERQVGLNGIPKWITEGSAEVTAYRRTGLSFQHIAPQVASTVGGAAQPTGPPGDDEFATNTTDLQRAYQRSWSWCSFLIARSGWPAFVDFVRTVKVAPHTWSRAFTARFDGSVASLAPAYRTWLKAPRLQPQASRANPCRPMPLLREPRTDSVGHMADSTSSSTEIAAAPAEVLDIIADFATYPEWAGQVKSAQVISEDADGWPEQVEFVLDAGVIKDTYTLGYDWAVTEDGTGTVSWHLVKSAMLKSLDGSYTLTNSPKGTAVTYNLTVDVLIPVIGMLRRKAEKMIIDTALQGLKKRAEG